ncbi:Uncharacterised protein [Salmonella enterica subsp. enterica serovar Bovismorbificans]|uniref:Uncharacterized protein n=1 Tax=Salmonella enterica subsp. enterica serovar Bovismorbificans TaxID=58097 RepID=A0A655DAL5_SALET|nr:Uncharacterised protein [Salmonella enterica subsp. enterica serovar Bovismorbificans]
MGIGYPGGIKMDRGNVQHLLDPVSVIQQTIVSRIGDNRMHRPLRLRGLLYLAFDACTGKFPSGNTAENAERIARRLQPERHHIAHHQQMRQRFMTITINK